MCATSKPAPKNLPQVILHVPSTFLKALGSKWQSHKMERAWVLPCGVHELLLEGEAPEQIHPLEMKKNK